ncbi:MAG: Acyl dehydratase [Chloroflexi bacterium]|jgi:acyl dehydratase|nr:MAG: Acyl dehydratase [Chloroflexota bacterium]|tara:strand:- start:2139 stop:2558 length:420 start_codon:yes stop_codon:yes gene_type:complete
MNIDINNIQIGQSFSQVVVENLSRTQIVQYAGVSGDFNPLHTDELFATEIAGYPSTFAHGMLGMALTGKAISSLFGSVNIKKYGVRFQNIIFPGDTLTTTLVIDSVETIENKKFVKINIHTLNQNEKIVIKGNAIIVNF